MTTTNTTQIDRSTMQALRFAAAEYLSPESTAGLYSDLSRSELKAHLLAAGVSPESEWSEDLLAAHGR